MPCSCCSSTDFGGVEEVFDPGRAAAEAETYLRAGLGARGRRLIAYLVENGRAPFSVLDVGSGVGGVHYELLRRGAAARAVGVEASSAYIDAAWSLGERLGLSAQVEYVYADFARAADAVEPADAVVLDRVICCYPHLEELLGAAARKAERFLALSYPKESWWVRLAFGLYNLSLRMRGRTFRTFVHPHREVDAIAARRGMRPVHSDTQGMWRIAVFARG